MLTIIIPTMNRSNFIVRMLEYYAKNDCNYQIVIGDSSNSVHVEKTKAAVEEYKNELNIVYKTFPGLNVIDCIREMNKLVSTPYVVLNCDDDLYIPNGLRQCINFLEKNHDYVSVGGISIKYKLFTEGPHGKFVCCMRYKLPALDGETPSARLIQFLEDYGVVMFNVHRFEAFKEMFPINSKTDDEGFDVESLPCCISAIQGKAKQLDTLFFLRQYHRERYMLSPYKEWYDGPTFKEKYERFRYFLAVALMKKENITISEANHVIDRGFKLYIDKFYYIPKVRIQLALSYLYGLRYVLRIIKDMSAYHSGPYSLPGLLNASSKYHVDFIQAYDVISQSRG